MLKATQTENLNTWQEKGRKAYNINYWVLNYNWKTSGTRATFCIKPTFPVTMLKRRAQM